MNCQNNKCQNNYVKCNKCHECDKCHECHKKDDCFRCRKCDGGEMHVHEYAESVKLAELEDDRHNHRGAGVTGEPILINNGTNHVHKIKDNTDFFDHFHVLCVTTGPAIMIPGSNGKHIHLVKGNTSTFDEHCHPFDFTTNVQAPLLPAEDCPAKDCPAKDCPRDDK